MSYMTLMTPCFSCGRTFTCNPDLVPSIRVNSAGRPDPNGKRKAICKACVLTANPKRIANGLPEIEIKPGAYEAQEIGI